MKNRLLCLLLVLVSCTPEEYYKADELQVGYALMRSTYGYPEPDTLFCMRKIATDTTYWETGCVYDRLTKGRKDTLYITHPWPLIRFVPYPKAIARFEKCD